MQNSTLEGFRLSPQQKYLWTLQQRDSALPYRVQCAVLIEGNLNPQILHLALQKVVNRHEIFRTSFQCLPGMTIPLQVIAENHSVCLNRYDLIGITEEDKASKIEHFLSQVSQQDSSLSTSLITLSVEQYVLLLSLSAMHADRYTLDNLVREISHCYAACLQEQELDDEPLQYADIAEWQYELLNSEDAAIGKEYWQKIDFIHLSKLNLPGERKNKQDIEFKPQSLKTQISQDLFRQIQQLAVNYKTTCSQLLLTCWQVLIGKLTGQTETIVGIASDGRQYEDLKPALGLLSKYLPLHCSLSAEVKFNQLLQQVQQLVQEAEQWQDYFHWEDFIELEQLNQSFPFLPVCFEFIAELDKYCEADLCFSISQQYTCTSWFKLKLSCTEKKDSLDIDLYYDSSLFDVAEIQRLSEYFITLLTSVVHHPEAAISDLEILSDRARNQILYDFNDTVADYPKNQCIHQLFETQTERTPDSTAVVFEHQSLTYRQLNKRANQLAHYLQKTGIKSEVVVGICLERSLKMIVAILGILKAGGAYLPLDPNMPSERLALMLQDAQVSVLLTDETLPTNFLPKDTIQVISLDTYGQQIAQESQDNCSSEVTTENLAYVIYTSGSTGTPKGVAVEHQQILNYFYGISPQLNLPAGSSFAMVSTFAADLGNTAIFPALCTGGCLHIISSAQASDPEALAAYFEQYPIDCLKIVPSHLAALLTSPKAAAILPRKRLVLGGEATCWELIDQIQQYHPECLVLNHYGPTEATVGVLTYEVDHSNLRDVSATVPLGRPIANTQIYLLDANLQPVPIGVTGELYIGGDSLARGYLNQPELTAEKFIANPFIDNSRLYKTGDAARYLPDGNIEFLGRLDQQVKIRGFRIELGEIEAAIRQHPEIEQVVVIGRENVPGEQHIVAYIVPKVQAAPDVQEYLLQKLPDYMIPSFFVYLKSLPLTANGKLDRQALPPPEKVRSQGYFVAPRNPIEATLAAIWAEVLKVEQVGINDNFFKLGGHSLLATQVISRLRQAFQIDLPLHCLFKAPTVADLADVIAEKLSEQADVASLDAMVAELEQLSDAEIQQLLANGGVN